MKRRIILIVLFAAVAVPFIQFVVAPKIELKRRTHCRANLYQIYGATVSLAFEHRYYRGDQITETELRLHFFSRGLPSCPSGGKYVLGPIGGHPLCTLHGDLLADEGGIDERKARAIPERPKN
jgi:hypothetical protein